jgi:TolA-binding protein
MHYLERAISEYPESRWAGDARVIFAQVLVKLGHTQEAADTLRAVANGPATAQAKREALHQLRKIEKRSD